MSDAELSGLANWLFGHGLMLFYGTLLCSVIGFAVLEWAAPKFSNQNRSGRWPTNFLLFALIFLIQLFVPVTALMAAIIAENTGMGLLNWLALPLWARGVLTLVVVDLVNYLRHWAFHKIPLLWRIHKIHHSDVALDASTFGRFHPLEIVPDLPRNPAGKVLKYELRAHYAAGDTI